MLNCKITKIPETWCDTSVSGILKVALVNWSEEYTFTGSGTDCVIDTIDLKEANFLPINVADNSAYANANANAGSSSDNKSIMHQVGGVINRLDCNVQSDWKNYLMGRVIFAVLTKNKQVLIFGADNGLTATNFDFATGTAEADAQGITFLYEGLQKNAPLIVKDWATIRALYPAEMSDVI